MTLAGSRLRQVGWAVVLAAVAGLFVALSFQVHSVKSEVLLAERRRGFEHNKITVFDLLTDLRQHCRVEAMITTELPW